VKYFLSVRCASFELGSDLLLLPCFARRLAKNYQGVLSAWLVQVSLRVLPDSAPSLLDDNNVRKSEWPSLILTFILYSANHFQQVKQTMMTVDDRNNLSPTCKFWYLSHPHALNIPFVSAGPLYWPILIPSGDHPCNLFTSIPPFPSFTPFRLGHGTGTATPNTGMGHGLAGVRVRVVIY